MKRRTNLFVAIAFMAGLAITMSCEKDSNDGDAPALPPATTITLDVDALSSAYQPVKSTEKVGTYYNIAMAVTAITYWNTNLVAGMALPVYAFSAVASQEPVRVDNNTWMWSASFASGDSTITAELTASVVEDVVNWEMSLKSTVMDFVWYTGTSNYTATSGTWLLYDNPADNNAFISINWTVDYEAETFDVKFTNVRTGDNYEDSYIEYGKTSTVDLFYEVYDSFDEVTYTILYDVQTHEGSISDGTNTYCWDINYLDTTCPV